MYQSQTHSQPPVTFSDADGFRKDGQRVDGVTKMSPNIQTRLSRRGELQTGPPIPPDMLAETYKDVRSEMWKMVSEKLGVNWEWAEQEVSVFFRHSHSFVLC